jgi:hypothetical protein
LLTIAVVAACGGSVASIDGDAGGVDSGSGDGSIADSSVDASADGGADSAPMTCAQQLAQLDAIRQATRKCCPTCNSVQCDVKVDDLCCPISATNPQAAQLMADAVSKYKAECGPIACPAMPCQAAPSNFCDPNTSLCR